MFGEHHDIPHEFPEYKDLVETLCDKNYDFQRKYTEYHTLDQEIRAIEQNVEPVSDQYAENLKKKRALLKDQIYTTLQAQRV